MNGDMDLVPQKTKDDFKSLTGLPLTNVVMNETTRLRLRGKRLAAAALAKTQPRLQGTIKRVGEQRGRNEPCPCGSGKKFKRCCGDFRGEG